MRTSKDRLELTFVIALVIAGLAIGCDVGTASRSNGMKGPPPTAVWHWPHGATVDEEATAAPLQGSIRVQFDRFLASDAARRQGICVQPASAGSGQCLAAGAGGITFTVQYDPVDRVVVLKPEQPLMPGTRYQVRLIPPKDGSDALGIRAFDGVPLAKEVSFAFTTTMDATATTQEPRRDVDFCKAADTACTLPTSACSPAPVDDVGYSVKSYVSGCAADTQCHYPPDTARKALGGATLLFDDGPDGGVPAAVKRLAQGRQIATETATDPDPGAPRTSGQDAFARNMPYIDPGNPGNSFIIYKMIIGMLRCPAGPDDAITDNTSCGEDGGYVGSAILAADFYKCVDLPAAIDAGGGPCPDYDAGSAAPVYRKGSPFPRLVESWVPEQEWKSPIVGEYDRLRLRIRGNPMPSPNGAAVPQYIDIISAWITQGAPVAECAP